MAAEEAPVRKPYCVSCTPSSNSKTEACCNLCTYLGLSFAIFLGFLPHSSSLSLQSRLLEAEEELSQMKSRRKEDSKANARVVEIFASHRNGWRQEEKRLLQQIDASAEEIALLRARIQELEKSEAQLSLCVDKLQKDVDDRDEMINFISRRRKTTTTTTYHGGDEFVVRSVADEEEEEEEDEEEVGATFCGSYTTSRYMMDDVEGLSRFEDIRVSHHPEDFLTAAHDAQTPGFLIAQHNKPLLPIPNIWPTTHPHPHQQQDIQCDPLESSYQTKHSIESPYQTKHSIESSYQTKHSLESSYQAKHFVARRESPWKVDGESIGVPSKLKVLEQELINLEKVDKGELSKIPSLLRKQARRYQALAGKIDDLCRKMRASEVSEPTLSFEFRTRYQTEFLIEAYRLQQRAIEIGQKLSTLQTETAKSNFSNGIEGHVTLTTRRSLDSIRNNLREIQRNLEVWLARILGDLEGILASDGASRVREYYMTGYPFQ